MLIARRKLLTGGLATLVCAPAIVRASSLMAISPLPYAGPTTGYEFTHPWFPSERAFYEGVQWTKEEIQFFLRQEAMRHLKILTPP